MKVNRCKPRRLVKVKSKAQYEALHRLDSFLNSENPRLVRFLVRTWNDQQTAITYKELREAILHGDLAAEALEEWQQDYAVFFNRYLQPILSDASNAGAKELAAAALSGSDVYAPMLDGVDDWIEAHGGEWITQMTTEAHEAVSTLIQYAAGGNTTVDDLARVIRPTIGLNGPQSLANFRFFEETRRRLIRELLDKHPEMQVATAERQATKRAKESAVRLAARQHRQRAEMIAQSELAFAYNKGADNAVRNAMDAGLMPRMKKQWSTAADEAVCATCGALDGVEVEMDDEFNFGGKELYAGQKLTPPAHPRCRCALCYVEADDAADEE